MHGAASTLQTNQSKFETVTDNYSRRDRNRKKRAGPIYIPRARVRVCLYIYRLPPIRWRTGHLFSGWEKLFADSKAETTRGIGIHARATRIETMVIKRCSGGNVLRPWSYNIHTAAAEPNSGRRRYLRLWSCGGEWKGDMEAERKFLCGLQFVEYYIYVTLCVLWCLWSHLYTIHIIICPLRTGMHKPMRIHKICVHMHMGVSSDVAPR